MAPPFLFLEKTQGLLNPRTGALISASLERYAKINFASESLSLRKPRMPVAEARHSRWASVARSVPSNPSLDSLDGLDRLDYLEDHTTPFYSTLLNPTPNKKRLPIEQSFSIFHRLTE